MNRSKRKDSGGDATKEEVLWVTPEQITKEQEALGRDVFLHSDSQDLEEIRQLIGLCHEEASQFGSYLVFLEDEWVASVYGCIYSCPRTGNYCCIPVWKDGELTKNMWAACEEWNTLNGGKNVHRE